MDTLSTSVSVAPATELLKKTWSILKERVKTLALLEIIKWVPSIILLIIFAAGIVPFSDINSVFDHPSLLGTFLPVAIILGIASVILQLAGLVGQVYTLAADHSVSAKETLPVIKKRFLPFVGYSLLNSIIVFVVTAVFAVPIIVMGVFSISANGVPQNWPLFAGGILILLVGILVVLYVSIRLTFTGIIAVIEPGTNALKVSWNTTKGRMKTVVARMLVLFLISILIYLPFAALTALVNPSSGQAGIVSAIIAQIIQFIGTFVGTMIGIGYNLQLLRQLQDKALVPASEPTTPSLTQI